MARASVERTMIRPHDPTDPSRPLFSVLVLVGDNALHLRGAVQSVWAQKACDLEIILIDGTDSAAVRQSLVELTRESALPTTLVRPPGVGWPSALGAGAEAATGRYLAFLDANDEYHPERLETFRRAHVICGGFMWGFSGVQAIDPQNRPVAVDKIREDALRSAVYASLRPAEGIRNLPLVFTPVSWANLVVDARMFRELGGFRGFQRVWAWDLALRMFRASDPVTIERSLYLHRLQVGEPFARGNAVARTNLAVDERTEVVEEFWRGMALDGLAGRPSMGSSTDALWLRPDPDARAAIAAAEWGLDQLRRHPTFYALARSSARIVRRARSRFR
jgi:hypothetical protein